MRMTNREKFREVYGFDTDCGKCNPYPCKEDDCEWWEQCKEHPGCPCENWWDLEYKAPTTKNNLAHNLCDSCTNIGCEFQSGIVRMKCAFYMPPYIEPDNCGNYVVQDSTIKNDLSSGLEKNSKKLEKDFGELDCISRADAIKEQI